MKKLLITAFLATTLLLNAGSILGNIDRATLSIGKSKDGTGIYRIGVRKGFGVQWAKNELGYASGYFELSANYWSKRDENNFGIALSPVLTYTVDFWKIKPYVEGGIGVSLWSKTKINGRDLSTNFLFEDRVGAGLRYGNFDLSFRYMHYSNAGIKHPNNGIDIFISSITYSF